MSVSICPNCGSRNTGDVANCLRCQTPLPAPQAPSQPVAPPCPHCGAVLLPRDRFCAACGRSPTAVAPAPAPAPPPAWQQPAPSSPPRHGYQEPQEENNSGTGGPAPPEVLGWNWGAFFLTWIWGISHGVWHSFLVIILGLIWQIALGAKGSEWAWKSRKFDSVQQFKDTQRAWAIWGGVAMLLGFVLGVIVGLMFAALIATAGLGSDSFNF